MNSDKDQSVTEATELRRRAEKVLHEQAVDAAVPRTDDETGRLLQELQVRQIELEMQNTELRQARDEIEAVLENYAAQAAALAAANIELEAFNFTVSHDLRSPLTAINGYSQLLRDLCGIHLDKQCRGYIEEIYEGSLRMNRLIDLLLKFSGVMRVEIRREEVNLSQITTEVAKRLKVMEPERQATFRIGEGVKVNADSGLMLVVINNLLENAWKYTVGQTRTMIEFGMAEIEGKPVYFVQDNGPGFEMAAADKLFIPFQRLPGSDIEGNGIGLATVDRIIKRHGGRVWAASEPGKGATFYFTLG